jgi:hypothetical protein
VDARTNPNACGVPGVATNPCTNCATTTGAGSICLSGACVCNIGTTPDTCDGTCVDLNANAEHCGECFNDCGDGQVCSGGACAASCLAPLVDCNGGCTNTTYDPNNCGTCGKVCFDPVDGAAVCSQGACAVVCDTGFFWDGSACVTLLALTYPATCAQVLYSSSAVDGERTLYLENDSFMPWLAYCRDMAGTPREYLTLPMTGQGRNFSQYRQYSQLVQTSYTRVRFDPSTLLIHTGDQTFSSSTGSLLHSPDLVTSMPYGVAMSCDGSASGTANINLSGTPFQVSDTFCLGGAGASGAVTFSSGNQVVDLTGGGFCGWHMPCPSIYNPYNNRGGWVLNVVYMPQ